MKGSRFPATGGGLLHMTEPTYNNGALKILSG